MGQPHCADFLKGPPPLHCFIDRSPSNSTNQWNLGWQEAYEDISHIVVCRYILHRYHPIFNSFTNEVIMNVDVFDPCGGICYL